MTQYHDHTNAGKTVEIDDADKAQWMLDQGYISKMKPSTAKDAGDRGVFATSPPAEKDPTLAQNRERPTPPSKIEPHLANLEGDDNDNAETVHGKNMGLDAEPVADTGPKVEIKTGKSTSKG